MPSTAPLVASLRLRLVTTGGGAIEVPADLSYDLADPYAVSATFTGDQDGVTWTFARDLLDEGLLRPVGDGDVSVWPCDDTDVICLALTSPFGQALLEARRGDVESFVARTFALVPRDHESLYIDIDAALADLLDFI